MKRNRVKEKLSQTGGIALGAWLQMGSPEIAEFIAHVGFDFVIVDREHGSFGLEVETNLFRAIESGGASPVIRLPDDSPSEISSALDAGAVGILIPGVSSRRQAEKIVSSAKYAPTGTRGACPLVRATDHGLLEWKGFQSWSNANTMVWLIIENQEGVKNFRDILSVPGVDAVSVGLFDLAQSLGYPGQIDHPEVTEKMLEIVKEARKEKVDIMSLLFETELSDIAHGTRLWIDRGCRIITVGSERQILSDIYRKIWSVIGSEISRLGTV
jgi:4-hydroxy-2-oxoheptanedioate aldolase